MGLKQFTNLLISMRSVSQVVLPDAYVPGARTDADRTVNVNDYAVQASLSPSTSPAPTEILVEEIALPVGGTVDLDLTAARILGALSGGDPAATEDLTGKVLTYLELHTSDANEDPVAIMPAAADGFELFGTGVTEGVVLPPGSHLAQYVASGGGAVVGAAAYAVTVSGTEGDELVVLMVFEDAPAP